MNDGRKYRDVIQEHYRSVWGRDGCRVEFPDGPVDELPNDFAVLEFEPDTRRSMWTYATCCMTQPSDQFPVELHIFSPRRSREPLELLFAISHYFRSERSLGVGHTVNFGKPWIDSSACQYGLISLPYLDGPDLENLKLSNGVTVKCLWLIPVTKGEVGFKKTNGLEALEEKFEDSGFDYLNPGRSSVC